MICATCAAERSERLAFAPIINPMIMSLEIVSGYTVGAEDSTRSGNVVSIGVFDHGNVDYTVASNGV